MNVVVNVIKKDKVFLFMPNGNFANVNVTEYYSHIRNYIAQEYPAVSYSFAIGDGEPYAVFIILDVNNNLEVPSQQQITI